MKNREIKFRVWNGMNMEYDVTVGKFGSFFVNPEKGDGLDPKDSASLTPCNTKYPDDIPIMQFTGMKDKNGKEIYEGDIVKYNHTTLEYEGEFELFIGNVYFDNDNYYGWRIKSNRDSSDSYGWEVIEVIGNTYENPDLLKV